MNPVVRGIGRVVVDHVVRLDHYPEKDTKSHIREHWFQVGGPVATALVTARRLGGHAASFMGQWGDDLHGQWIHEDLASEGIDTSLSVQSETARTAFSHIWVDGEGRRTIAYARGDFSPFTHTDVRDADFRACRVLHLDGEYADAALKAASVVREGGGVVTFDAGSPKPGSDALYALTDIIIASRQCVRERTGTEDPDAAASFFLERGAGAVVLTRGEDGASYVDAGESFHQPAFPVQATDTTGAGDVFCGALIHALLTGMDRRTAVRFAGAAAAWKCRGHGNRKALPSAQQVQALLDDAAGTGTGSDRMRDHDTM